MALSKPFGTDWVSDAHEGVLELMRMACRILNMCEVKILREFSTEKIEGTYQKFIGTDHQCAVLLLSKTREEKNCRKGKEKILWKAQKPPNSSNLRVL